MARECPFKKTQNCPQQRSKPGFKKPGKHQEQQMQRFQALHQQAKIRAIPDSEDESDLDTDEDDSVETYSKHCRVNSMLHRRRKRTVGS